MGVDGVGWGGVGVGVDGVGVDGVDGVGVEAGWEGWCKGGWGVGWGGLQIIPTHFMGTNFEVYILLLYKSTTCPGTILCTRPAKGDDAII